MICRVCHEVFDLKPGKPGYANVCVPCTAAKPPREPAMVGGNMIWSHKTAPSIEIKSMKAAKRFAKLQRRRGPGPLSSIVEVREPHHFGDE